ncbi:MAG: FkbM family methyltransferase [Marmoricola sp.]|nr:FkbM family methyltransferase [Marmoricola sp.]
MLINDAIALAYDAGFQMVGIEQGWAAPSGQMLQADGVFFRL